MTSFESNSKNSGNIFGFSNGRKRRQESTRKTQTRKVLDQFVLEKMEDRWLPAVSWVNSGNVLTFTFSSNNDNLTLTPAPVRQEQIILLSRGPASRLLLRLNQT